MKIKEKNFKVGLNLVVESVKTKAIKDYDLNPVNNIYLISQKLLDTAELDGNYVECGTFRGNTLVPAALFCVQKSIKTKLVGIDTFSGFPEGEGGLTYREYDKPEYFEILYKQGEISEEHWEKAKQRTNNFTDLSHLDNEYFQPDTEAIFEIFDSFNNIEVLQGTFEDITPKYNEKISVLHLDGDLYESYMTCLNNLYDNVISGGAIIFDEYYSLKYPGARVAVNEFFKNKKQDGWFEKYITSEGHERWCYTKK